MVPITRLASSPNKKCGIFVKIIMIRSIVAASIVQDTFSVEAEEGEGGEEETT